MCRTQVQERAAVPVEILIVPQIPITAVGKVNKPVLRAETMLRVAREQAAAVVGERGTSQAELDESGVRPRVRLDVSAVTGDVSSLRNELQAAFCRYEFQTVISVQAAKTGT